MNAGLKEKAWRGLGMAEYLWLREGDMEEVKLSKERMARKMNLEKQVCGLCS